MKTLGLIVALAALAVTGCSGLAEKTHWDLIKINSVKTNEQANSCLSTARSSDTGLEVSKKFVMTMPYRLEKFQIKEMTSVEDTNNIVEYHNALQLCRKIAIEGYSAIHSEYVILLANFYRKTDALNVRLLAHKISIGGANKVLALLRIEFYGDWAGTSERHKVDYAKSYANEKQHRPEAKASMQKWNLQQKILDGILDSDIKTTNCKYTGDIIYCEIS